jgi:hypothetical protein
VLWVDEGVCNSRLNFMLMSWSWTRSWSWTWSWNKVVVVDMVVVWT